MAATMNTKVSAVSSYYRPNDEVLIWQQWNIVSDESDEFSLGEIENTALLAIGGGVDGTTQMASILKRVAKLEANFERFVKRFDTSGSSSSEFITSADEHEIFEPIDTIERLDEFEEHLRDPKFENTMVIE